MLSQIPSSWCLSDFQILTWSPFNINIQVWQGGEAVKEGAQFEHTEEFKVLASDCISLT